MFELGIQKNWIDALYARSSVRQYTGAPDKEQLDRLGETCRKLSWQGVKIRMFKGPGLKSQIKGTDVYAVIVAKRGTPMEVEGYMGEALVLEAFSEVRAVRCFPNTDETGAHRPGHVAVVLLTGNYDSEAHTIAVCEQVEHYLRALCDSRLAREGLHVLPAMVMTVNVTASVEVDAPDNAAQAERGAQECLQALLDPFCAERGENPIGALPGLTDLYAALRRVPHILAVRDVLLEGSYYDYNRSRVVALDVGSSYPFAVPRSGRHVLRI